MVAYKTAYLWFPKLWQIENSLVILELRIKAFEIAWGVDGDFFNIFVVIANVLALIGRWTVIMPSSLNSVYAHPHCWCINLQWGLLILKKDHTQEPDSNYVQESLNLPISLKIVVCGISTCNVLINTYCYIHATLPTLTIGRNPYNADTKHYYLIVGK